MKRHCPRCGKPTAIVVTSKQHATRLGEVTEQEWRCEDCFKHFKLHSPKWDAFWLVFAVAMIAFGIAVIAGAGNVKASQRTGLTLLLLAQGIAAGAYSAHLVRLRKRSPLVSGE